jgi:hypothetical protein
MSPSIKIDFHGGTHGHFLEYVVNTYIFKCPSSIDSIFSVRGSTVEIDRPDRRVVCGHFSETAQGRDADPKYVDFEFNQDDRVIRINLDQTNDVDFFIGFTNLIYRSSGATVEDHMAHIPEHIRNNKRLLRNDFYSKINERKQYANLFPKFTYTWPENFDFPFWHFYNFTDFCGSLHKLAVWTNESFTPSEELYILWEEFINKNQGLSSYSRCEDLLTAILGNQFDFIDLTVLEEAWVLYNIAKITGVYLEFDEFPTSTQQIYEMLK